ncbi:hypothetical protein LIER_40394 [Lithospermum erythrorhizon]|uniref:Wall-associated receptor kinase galacturonan-binding domain-containing protein n=1 Tax=Lithospermum erythrorhizon TaxID=34254 RepID=A0AAV3QV75_LITER
MSFFGHLRWVMFDFLISLIIYAQLSGCQSDDRYESAVRFSSVEQNVGYPFWGKDRPEYCGYPGFELKCDGDVPHITIKSILYRVVKVGNDNFTVARDDLWNSPPTQFHNTTLDFNLFNYTQHNQSLLSLFFPWGTISVAVPI